MKYRSRSGEMWDEIAFKEMGDSRYMGALLQANCDRLWELTLAAGEELEIPAAEKSYAKEYKKWEVENE